MSWNFTDSTPEKLTQVGFEKTTAIKQVTRGEHKGKWRLWWNPAAGGVWVREN